MMKHVTRIIILVCLYTLNLNAQGVFEVRLVPTNISDSPDILCFDTQFKNISDKASELSGQNYRLYYDAVQLELKNESIKSYLPESGYGALDLNQALHNIDARGYGDLKFDKNLGFINYSVRVKDSPKNIIELPAASGWLSTTNVCFQANNTDGAVSIVWGRYGLTDGYATAYTEISNLNRDGEDVPGVIQIYQDYIKLSDGTGVNDPMVLQSTQNH